MRILNEIVSKNPYHAIGTLGMNMPYLERSCDLALEQAIIANERVALLYAPSRSGKSSMLHRIEMSLKKKGYLTYSIDITACGFFSEIKSKYHLNPNSKGLEPLLNELKKILREQDFVFLLDEFTAKRKELFAEIYAIYANSSKRKQYERFHFVLSGINAEEMLALLDNKQFFSWFTPEKITEEQYHALAKPLAEAFSVNPCLVHWLQKTTQGDVASTHYILEALFDRAVESESHIIDWLEFKAAVEQYNKWGNGLYPSLKLSTYDDVIQKVKGWFNFLL